MSDLVLLTLIEKPGCHLCTDAQAAITATLASLEASNPELKVTLEHRNILEDEALAQRYADEIPVVLINGSQHAYWHVEPDRLAQALLKEVHK